MWHALRWLIGDTVRQALRSGASWLMLAGSAACIMGCLVAPLGGPADAHAVEQQLAAWVVHVAALLVALTATAGMLPAFFAPHTAAVLLAKPTPRPLLLAGKCLGVIAFVAVHAAILVGGSWLALAARSGAWDTTYLLSAPLMVLHFAVFFGFSVMLASATRNGAACAFGTVLFWLLCWAMNFGRHAAIGVTRIAHGFAGVRLGHRRRLLGAAQAARLPAGAGGWRARRLVADPGTRPRRGARGVVAGPVAAGVGAGRPRAAGRGGL